MKKNTASGFSLIELSIVMIVVGLLISVGFSLMPNYLQSSKVTAARTQMKEIQNAIEGFAIANNRLPCPDSTGDGLEDLNASSICTAQHDNATGATNDTNDLPYRTLGLSNNRDPWGRVIKYAALMRRTTDTYCTTDDSCDLATKRDSTGATPTTLLRTDFCTKLTRSMNHILNSPSLTTDIGIARLQYATATVTKDADSDCTTGSKMAYILASSGFNDADQDTNTGGYTIVGGLFDGANNPGGRLCFENPDRVLRFLDASEQKSTDTPDNYDDIVLGGSVSGLISRLECN
ncbi:MAG: type II secretion system protein GspG [Magnetococcales bacterium]|nr:type II secretion system protein GspG [Magnetococcales bacterium]